VNDADDGIAPGKLLQAFGGEQHFVFGDLEICPFTTERGGHMQIVCVEQANNFAVRPYGHGAKE
jgi:hypothetical protein